MKILNHVGAYFIMLYKVFGQFTPWSIQRQLILRDIDTLIIGSMGTVIFLSFFVGGVVTIQTALNVESPLIPKEIVGFATRQSIILEFSPTLISIIMAGKVGSYITSSIGTMRVTEQIDALEIMGVNTYNYLIFPKIVAMMIYPILITFSMAFGIYGGYLAAVYGGFGTSSDFLAGVTSDFRTYHVIYAYIKTGVFAFLLATIPAYHGYFLKGGSLQVGKASTVSFIWTSTVIIVVNYFLTQLMLT
ncbi:MAG: ABC transporter permease [Flavobacteriaceae bacterium]|nr:ABC transporter permease [Flavobacteriaceae bacterium]